MKVLLLDAYNAASHQYWRQALKLLNSDLEYTELVLPARYFSWRIRGNSLTWGKGDFPELHSPTLDQDYDLVIATSMVDLSALRGFIPLLGLIPTLVYFHENQFDYPVNQGNKNSQQQVEPQIVNLYTALCADQIAFNSDYNRQTFLAGVKKLFKKLPDQLPKGLSEELEEKSIVLPVPIVELKCELGFELKSESEITSKAKKHEKNRYDLIWNHRWEYDKGPEYLLAFVKELITQQVEINLHIIGQSFRQQPKEFSEIEALLADNEKQKLINFGFIESELDYQVILKQADFVLSTSLHDFQGLSILQAVALGAQPIVPNRLAYPQWFGSDNCYQSFIEDGDGGMDREAKSAVSFLKVKMKNNGAEKVDISEPSLSHLALKNLAPKYLACFNQLLESK